MIGTDIVRDENVLCRQVTYTVCDMDVSGDCRRYCSGTDKTKALKSFLQRARL